MKKYFLPFLTLLLFACKKNDGHGGYSIDKTTIAPPGPSPVNVDLVAYPYNMYQSSNPLYLANYNNGAQGSIDYVPDFQRFFAKALPLDKYLSHIEYDQMLMVNQLGFYQYKSFDVPGNARTYVGFKYLNYSLAGNINNSGGILNVDGNGKLSFPAQVFNSIGLDMRYNVYIDYLDPTTTDFSVSLPALPFADYNGGRWFLDSYGVYQIRPILTYCNCSVLGSSDLFGKEVTLEMPIPDSLQTNAPDSVEAWHLNAVSLLWEQKGYAYKKNGVYEKGLLQSGVWNFARPLAASYVTLQLRTTNDIALPNTRFIIKNNNYEVAEGRTDMDGNALVLVPANKTLSFNVINDHYVNYPLDVFPDQSIGSFPHTVAKKIVLPDRIDIGTLDGAVYNCNGGSFGNGSVLISQNGAKDDYVVPIVNGKFSTANWITDVIGTTKLSFRDASGATAFEVSTYIGSRYTVNQKRLKENFYPCANANYLYCNYQIDNTYYSINGDTSHASPVLINKMGQYSGWNMVLQDGNKGISCYMSITNYEGDFDMALPLKINNADYKFDYSKNSEVVIYRNDAKPNGFIEGWFCIHYLDGNNASHTVTGNFRLKIVPE